MLKLKGNLEFDSTHRPADHLHQHPTNSKIATMKTAFATLALAASASAFAPAPVSTKKTQLSEFANGLVGGEGPEPMFTGSKEFDPVGFTEVRFLCHENATAMGCHAPALWASVWIIIEYIECPSDMVSFLLTLLVYQQPRSITPTVVTRVDQLVP